MPATSTFRADHNISLQNVSIHRSRAAAAKRNTPSLFPSLDLLPSFSTACLPPLSPSASNTRHHRDPQHSGGRDRSLDAVHARATDGLKDTGRLPHTRCAVEAGLWLWGSSDDEGGNRTIGGYCADDATCARTAGKDCFLKPVCSAHAMIDFSSSARPSVVSSASHSSATSYS